MRTLASSTIASLVLITLGTAPEVMAQNAPLLGQQADAIASTIGSAAGTAVASFVSGALSNTTLQIQTVTKGLTMNQAGGTGNTQAGQLFDSTLANEKVYQDLTVQGGLNMTQQDGTNNVQAGQLAKASNGAFIVQRGKVDTATLTQTGGNGNSQAMQATVKR